MSRPKANFLFKRSQVSFYDGIMPCVFLDILWSLLIRETSRNLANSLLSFWFSRILACNICPFLQWRHGLSFHWSYLYLCDHGSFDHSLLRYFLNRNPEDICPQNEVKSTCQLNHDQVSILFSQTTLFNCSIHIISQ